MRAVIVGLFIYIILAGLTGGPLSFDKGVAGEVTLPPPTTEIQNGKAGPTAEMTDIHDIKAPTSLAFNPAWAWYGLGLLLGILMILLAVMLVRRKKKQGKPESPAPKAPPEETAYRLLKDILPMLDSDGKNFYFRLSIIIRGYIRDRFGINALEMTTEELIPKIVVLDMDQDLKDGLKSLFHASDPVKFAGRAATRHEMKMHYDFAHDFIEKTTPVGTIEKSGGVTISG